MAGRTVGVQLVSGEVFILVPAGAARATGDLAPVSRPGGGRGRLVPARSFDVIARLQEPGPGFVSLKGVASIPVGSTIDARKGTLDVTAATAASAGAPTGVARLAAAVFKIRQRRAVQRRRARAVPADLVLRTPAGAAAQAGCSTGRRPGKGIVRTLGGASRRGFFRTVGVASTTTVRNGVWSIKDRCDGTLTQVGRGTAIVKPRRGRPVRVRAGQGYFVPGNFLALDSPKGRPR